MKIKNWPAPFVLMFVYLFLFPLKTESGRTGPVIIESPAPYSVIFQDSVEISGRARPAASLKMNSQEVPLDKTGNFRLVIPLPHLGKNYLYFNLAAAGDQKISSSLLSLIRGKTFADIKNHWARPEIETLATLKILGDESFAENFNPASPVSRKFFIVWLFKSLGKKPTTSSQSSFKDVKTTDAVSAYLEIAKKNRWFPGLGEVYFFPQKNVTRLEALTSLLRTFNLAPVEPVTPDKLKKYRFLAAKAGFIPEKWARERKPSDLEKPLTRAEAAYLLAQTKSVKLKYNSLFEDLQPILKEIFWELTQDSAKQLINFKIKIQKANPLYSENNPQVFLFSPAFGPSLELEPEAKASLADDVFYTGKIKLANSIASIFPLQIEFLDSSGWTQNWLFSSKASVESHNQSLGQAGLKILKIKMSPETVSLKANEACLLEVVFSPQQKQQIKKVLVNLKTLGRIVEAPAFDDGLLGDKKADDQTYSLLIKPSPKIKPGPKEIIVIAEDSSHFKKFVTQTLEITE